MKTSILLGIIITVAILSCGKGRFQTIPQLRLKSRTTEPVPVNGSFRFNVEYTDKEGDVSDSLIIVRQRLNKRGTVTLPPSPYKIPDFPKTDKGEFEVTLAYQFGLIFGLNPIRITGSNPVQNEVDTLRLKVVARDKAGNKSDTLVVDNVYVTR